LRTECVYPVAAHHHAETFISEQIQQERRNEDVENELRAHNRDLQSQHEGLRETIAAFISEEKVSVANMKKITSRQTNVSEEVLHGGTSGSNSDFKSSGAEAKFGVSLMESDADRKRSRRRSTL
jgi:hypothetical protein